MSSLTVSDVVTIAVGFMLLVAGLTIALRTMYGGMPPESTFWVRGSGLLLILSGTIVLELDVLAVMRVMASPG